MCYVAARDRRRSDGHVLVGRIAWGACSEGFLAAEWRRFDVLCEGLEGCWGYRRLTPSGASRTSRLRRTASVRESETTSNPESGKICDSWASPTAGFRNRALGV